jgi:hypothetical protein
VGGPVFVEDEKDFLGAPQRKDGQQTLAAPRQMAANRGYYLV